MLIRHLVEMWGTVKTVPYVNEASRNVSNMYYLERQVQKDDGSFHLGFLGICSSRNTFLYQLLTPDRET